MPTHDDVRRDLTTALGGMLMLDDHPQANLQELDRLKDQAKALIAAWSAYSDK